MSLVTGVQLTQHLQDYRGLHVVTKGVINDRNKTL